MRISSVTAALLASAVLAGAAAAPARAQVPARTGVAWIPSCTEKKTGVEVPCGTWRLVAPGGRATTVPGIAATAVDGRGRSTGEPAPFAVSADGHTVAHQRARDHRLVVWHLPSGRRTTLPASLLPKGSGTDLVGLRLSPAGDRVLVDYRDDAERVPTRIYTLATGKTVSLRGGDRPLGFSPDGRRVLTERTTGDFTVALIAHRLDGGSVKRTPPQVVANAAVKALADDGRTVAVFVAGDPARDRRPRLRLYDLETGELSAGVDLGLDPRSTPYAARWGKGGTITAILSDDGEERSSAVRVLAVDPETGAVKQTERYRLSARHYEYHAAGE